MTTDQVDEVLQSQRNLVLALPSHEATKVIQSLSKKPNSFCVSSKRHCPMQVINLEDIVIPDKLDLLVIEDLQILSNRQLGSRLDLLVAHCKVAFPRMRIIAMSTVGIGNADEVAKWLHHSDGRPAKYVQVDTLKRADVQVIGRPSAKSPFLFESHLDRFIPTLFIEQCVVVCSTRKSCESGAQAAVKKPSTSCSVEFEDKKLTELVSGGSAYYHAGVSQKDRHFLERLFEEGKLGTLFMTLPLALSFRPHINNIILKGTNMYNLKEKRYTEYPSAELLQLASKAQEKFTLLTEDNKFFKYQNLLNQELSLKSFLQDNLDEIVVRAVSLNYKTKHSLQAWYQETFPSSKKRDLGSVFDKMLSDGLLTNLITGKTNELQVEEGTKSLIKWSIPLSSFAHIQLMISEDYNSLGELLWSCSTVVAKWGVRVNQGDKKVMHKLESLVRYPLPARAKMQDDLPSKLFLFLQMRFDCLEDIAEASFSHKNELTHLLRLFESLLECLMEISLSKLFLELLICVKNGCWPSGPGCLQQHVHGLGSAYSRILCDRGINTFQKLRQTDPRRIELLLRRQIPFGDTILNQLKNYPSVTETEDEIIVEAKNCEYSLIYTNKKRRLVERDDKRFPKEEIEMLAFEKYPVRYSNQNNSSISSINSVKSNVSENPKPVTLEFEPKPTFTAKFDCNITKNAVIENANKELAVSISPKKKRVREEAKLIACNHTCKNKLLCKHACCKRAYEPALVFSSQEHTIPKDIDSTLEWLRHYRLAPPTIETTTATSVEYQITFYNNRN